MIKPISIYVHIPFCNSKCYYCGFASFVQNDQTKEQYFKALENEILSFDIEENYIVKTIYIGGGTPSSVNPKVIEQVLNSIKNKFKVDKNAEITIECNPNSTDEKKLAFYKKIGVNRLSFGVQSFNKHSLKFVGRIQNDENALKNYEKNTINVLKTAKHLGFNNVSADFILGLPYQKTSQIKQFLKKLSKLVTHFSCYMLMIEENTKLAQILPNGIDDEKVSKQYELTVKFLKKLGFERYEISNFAKTGFESKHNQVYWDMGEYIGFGLASHSFYDNKRVTNTENLKDFISLYSSQDFSKNEDKNLIKTVENLSKEELVEETIMLALRTSQGLDVVKFKNDYYDLEQKKVDKIAYLLNSGFIEFENNFLRLSDKGYLVANKIILELVD